MRLVINNEYRKYLMTNAVNRINQGGTADKFIVAVSNIDIAGKPLNNITAAQILEADEKITFDVDKDNVYIAIQHNESTAIDEANLPQDTELLKVMLSGVNYYKFDTPGISNDKITAMNTIFKAVGQHFTSIIIEDVEVEYDDFDEYTILAVLYEAADGTKSVISIYKIETNQDKDTTQNYTFAITY